MCAAAIKEAEATCAECTHIQQQSHGGMYAGHREREAIEEEGRNCQSFLTTCRVAL